tara:strand:+ start:1364 stop:1579 length:216 start_codon:yes stop_codon:yes gene_type:complete
MSNQTKLKPISLSEYSGGKGYCCPNFKKGGYSHCPESSLSVSWAVDAAKLDKTYPTIHCFQCGVALGVVVE